VSRRCPNGYHRLLRTYVKRRGSGEPLQYILGSEYFGDLEIKCRPGVLIPRFVGISVLSFCHFLILWTNRQETATAVSCFVHRMTANPICAGSSALRVLDLCTGTGCIPLLFHHQFYTKFPAADVRLQLVGVDISRTALAVAQENLGIQIKAQRGEYGSGSLRQIALEGVRLVEGNVLDHHNDSPTKTTDSLLATLKECSEDQTPPRYDILISNPPYISSKAFRTTTSRSVRNFEPTLALVPPTHLSKDPTTDGDVFYPSLQKLAKRVEAKALLFEVSDMQQAMRVALMCIHEDCWDGIEIWCDDPSDCTSTTPQVTLRDKLVKVRGAGNGRSVFAYRKSHASWSSD